MGAEVPPLWCHVVPHRDRQVPHYGGMRCCCSHLCHLSCCMIRSSMYFPKRSSSLRADPSLSKSIKKNILIQVLYAPDIFADLEKTKMTSLSIKNSSSNRANQLKPVITTNVKKNASYNSCYTKWEKQQKLPILFSSFNP